MDHFTVTLPMQEERHHMADRRRSRSYAKPPNLPTPVAKAPALALPESTPVVASVDVLDDHHGRRSTSKPAKNAVTRKRPFTVHSSAFSFRSCTTPSPHASSAAVAADSSPRASFASIQFRSATGWMSPT